MTERESLKAFEYALEEAVDSAVVYVAHAGGCFWGAGATERAAIRRAQAAHRDTSGETLPSAWIELSEIKGSRAFDIIEKARLRGWGSIGDKDIYER